MKHFILVDNQHAFRSERSCETQLLQAVHNCNKILDEKGTIDIIYI